MVGLQEQCKKQLFVADVKMKPLKIVLLLFLYGMMALVLRLHAQEKKTYDYQQFKHWHYDIKVEVIILMPEDFKTVRDYYFDIEKHPKRHKYVAFTTWYRIEGELKPFMFLQTCVNLAPLNDDIGHEMKHIINWKHKMSTGEFLFALPCDDWR